MNKETYKAFNDLFKYIENKDIGDWVKVDFYILMAKGFLNHFDSLADMHSFLEENEDDGPFSMIAEEDLFIDINYGPLTITYRQDNGLFYLEDYFDVWDDKNTLCVGEGYTHKEIISLAETFPKSSFLEYTNIRDNEKEEEQLQ